MAISLRSIVLDSADITTSAQFYSDLMGWPITSTDDDWINVDGGADVKLAFQLAPDHVPPQWPKPEHPQQLHIDFTVDDMDAEQERALALGARLLDDDASHPDFRVFADPAGHPFCLCTG